MLKHKERERERGGARTEIKKGTEPSCRSPHLPRSVADLSCAFCLKVLKIRVLLMAKLGPGSPSCFATAIVLKSMFCVGPCCIRELLAKLVCAILVKYPRTFRFTVRGSGVAGLLCHSNCLEVYVLCGPMLHPLAFGEACVCNSCKISAYF